VELADDGSASVTSPPEPTPVTSIPGDVTLRPHWLPTDLPPHAAAVSITVDLPPRDVEATLRPDAPSITVDDAVDAEALKQSVAPPIADDGDGVPLAGALHESVAPSTTGNGARPFDKAELLAKLRERARTMTADRVREVLTSRSRAS
jgi:hypothetical protein